MNYIPFLASLVIAFTISCTPEEEVINTDPVELKFSSDTVIFDTLFTTVGSISKRVKIYNTSKNAIELNTISVEGIESPYNLVVKGEPTNEVRDVVLLGKDSLELLISVNIDPGNQDMPFIINDSIRVSNKGLDQFIKLVAWGQDAHFLNDSILACDAVWDGDKPWVIYNSVLIDTLCTLNIMPGAKIYSHAGSTIYIKGTVNAIGTPDERILFSNDRFDGAFRNSPGQWEGIYFLEGSKDNEFEYVEIKNSKIGLRLGSPDEDTDPDVFIRQSSIHNISEVGILAFTSDLAAENLLIYNCGIHCIANLAGGNYLYNHCTIVNYPLVFVREEPVAVFSDHIVLPDNSLLEDDMELRITNSVIWGILDDEIILNSAGNKVFSTEISSSLLKTGLDLDINNNLLNIEPGFTNPNESNFIPDDGSPLINSTSSTTTIDFAGNQRDENPDIGALEKVQ